MEGEPPSFWHLLSCVGYFLMRLSRRLFFSTMLEHKENEFCVLAKWWKTDWPVESNIWYFCGNLKDTSSVSPGLKPPKSQPQVSSQDMGYCPNSVLSFNVFYQVTQHLELPGIFQEHHMCVPQVGKQVQGRVGVGVLSSLVPFRRRWDSESGLWVCLYTCTSELLIHLVRAMGTDGRGGRRRILVSATSSCCYSGPCPIEKLKC